MPSADRQLPAKSLPHRNTQSVAPMTYGECVLDGKLSLRETLHLLRSQEKPVVSRFWFGSPCRFVRQVDVLAHIVVPELLERRLPRLANYLRKSSPRWGRSWRDWQRGGTP